MKKKFVVITGISSGIGEALAKFYASKKYHLFGCARNEERINQVREECLKLGAASVNFKNIDVSNKQEITIWLNKILDHYDIDLVILNAGISAGMLGGQELPDNVEKIFQVNLFGVIYPLNLIIPNFVEKKKGQIAIVSSLAALRGLPSCPSYSASKAGVKAYAEALRPLLAKSNVGVSLILPGYVHSRITEKNNFPMPLIMSQEKAAKIIATRLESNPAIITFPLIMYLVTLFLSLLPRFIGDFICGRLPTKSEDKK